MNFSGYEVIAFTRIAAMETKLSRWVRGLGEELNRTPLKLLRGISRLPHY